MAFKVVAKSKFLYYLWAKANNDSKAASASNLFSSSQKSSTYYLWVSISYATFSTSTVSGDLLTSLISFPSTGLIPFPYGYYSIAAKISY